MLGIRAKGTCGRRSFTAALRRRQQVFVFSFTAALHRRQQVFFVFLRCTSPPAAIVFVS
jgi:hypothetical protein